MTSQEAMKTLADNGIPIEGKGDAVKFLDKHLRLATKESEREFKIGGEAKIPFGGLSGHFGKKTKTSV